MAPGTPFHETMALLVVTADTFRDWTELLSTVNTEGRQNLTFPVCVIYAYFHIYLVTCLSCGGGDGTLSVSEDWVDGDGVLGACAKTLDHVEVEGVPEVYVLYVVILKDTKRHRGT